MCSRNMSVVVLATNMQLPTFIEKYFKVWGVGFESDLPPEFIISTHAEERMRERMKCSKDKMVKLVAKAFYGKSVPIPKLERIKNKTHYRYDERRFAKEMMGFVFVFVMAEPRHPLPRQKVLITVI